MFEIADELEKEMASFYTEGLVEKETRKFCKQHKALLLQWNNIP